jgi:hypothetical protein
LNTITVLVYRFRKNWIEVSLTSATKLGVGSLAKFTKGKCGQFTKQSTNNIPLHLIFASALSVSPIMLDLPVQVELHLVTPLYRETSFGGARWSNQTLII